ncbi:hypothetical protein [Rhabdothermincola salaria]|uniref:hypothetical protein n=1 Tax=Rhabdothermincola salaria TaxID=2903142 RepID=UPI001E3BE9B2|nr:hypothetical protein [Rhabdothermincola salaria]MCD9622443.1 hypothetical protein [Rhabdothermincola salaria]
MRLLQLTLDPERDAVLELHGAMTVITGMSDRERQRLIRIVTAVAKGEDPGTPGLVEAHGVVLDLTSEVLALLDTGADVDPLVRRRDLPGAAPSPAEDGADDAFGSSVDPAEVLLSSAPKGAHPELDRHRRRLHDAVQTREVLQEAAAQAARDLDAAGRDRRRAVEHLDGAHQRAAEPLGPEHRTGPAGVEVAELEAEIAHIEAGVAELESLDIRPIAVLLDAIENPGPVEEVPSPRAQALADRFVALQGQVAALEEGLEAEGRGPVSAMRRLDEARAEVAAAERMRDRAEVTPDDEAELRRAHERVLESERKASGLRSRSGQRKLADALARQQEILDRVGYPTWSAFIMGASLMGADPAGEERLAAAQADLEAAEAHWVEISAALEADPDHHALLDELEQVELDAVGLLLERGIGVPDERNGLEETLRALREPKHEVDPTELVDALAFHLTSIGMDLGEMATDPEHVRRVAGAFLEEAAGIRDRIDELGVERRRLEARLADARSRAEAEAWAALEASVEMADPGEATLAELEEALAEARRREDDLAEVLEAREALLETAVDSERQAREQALSVARSLRNASPAAGEGGSDGSSDPGTVRPGWSEIDPEAIEFYLLARLAAQRQVSYSGSVPALVDDALAGVPQDSVRRVLDGLARMSAAVQVVYLTDDPSVLAWAREHPDTAAVVSWSSAVAETRA